MIEVDYSLTDLNREKSANFLIKVLTIILTIVIMKDPRKAIICGRKTLKSRCF